MCKRHTTPSLEFRTSDGLLCCLSWPFTSYIWHPDTAICSKSFGIFCQLHGILQPETVHPLSSILLCSRRVYFIITRMLHLLPHSFLTACPQIQAPYSHSTFYFFSAGAYRTNKTYTSLVSLSARLASLHTSGDPAVPRQGAFSSSPATTGLS